MKQCFVIALSLILILSLAACGGSKSYVSIAPPDDNAPENPSSGQSSNTSDYAVYEELSSQAMKLIREHKLDGKYILCLTEDDALSVLGQPLDIYQYEDFRVEWGYGNELAYRLYGMHLYTNTIGLDFRIVEAMDIFDSEIPVYGVKVGNGFAAAGQYLLDQKLEFIYGGWNEPLGSYAEQYCDYDFNNFYIIVIIVRSNEDDSVLIIATKKYFY